MNIKAVFGSSFVFQGFHLFLFGCLQRVQQNVAIFFLVVFLLINPFCDELLQRAVNFKVFLVPCQSVASSRC